MIRELERPAMMILGIEDEGTAPSAFFRGLAFAVAVSVPMWIGLVWTVTKIV